MYINEKIISRIPDDPVQGIMEICDIADAAEVPDAHDWSKREYDIFFECFSAVLSVLDAFELSHAVTIPELTGQWGTDASSMMNFLRSVRAEYQGKAASTKLDLLKKHFTVALGKGFVYELSTGDLNRIQHLLNELREQISGSTLIENEHKQRLLQRLERLQSELHKRMSDLDRFWGLVGDAGVVLRKLGEDAKPIVDRIKEIADIVWRTQSRAEELPSDTPRPLLESDDDA